MLDIAKKAALKAWKEIIKIYKWNFEIEIKEDNSPVTIADKLANKIIIDELTQTNLPILSEENKDNLDRLKSEYLWIIDPVDWTKDFIRKTWEFSIMIWLVKNWKPILWVVCVPTKNKLYFAEKWKWSYLEENWIIKKLTIDSNNQKILISRNHTTEIELKLIKDLWFKSIACWSIWVKLWLIAEWLAWNYINLYNKLKEWDTCAPEIILTEAWWKVTDINWENLIYNKKENYHNWCISTNIKLHNNIINKIKWI
jgi:3'(2'), 5'-bisphosphate nucleotidase